MIAYAGTEFEKELEYLFCTGCGMQREYEVILDTSFDGKMESKDDYKERQAKGNDV